MALYPRPEGLGFALPTLRTREMLGPPCPLVPWFFVSIHRLLILSLCLTFLTGCAARMATTEEAWRPNGIVIPAVGAMWTQHPIQGGFEPPIVMLPEGEPVRILRNHLGFTRIQLSDLRTGWVARGTAQKR